MNETAHTIRLLCAADFRLFMAPASRPEMSRSKDINMGTQASPISFPPRRILRLSVRGLIILVLFIGLWLGWLVRCARVQLDAVAAIEHAGGKVAYDWEWSSGKLIPGGKPWSPRWLTDLIGVDYFGHVRFVWLRPSESDDAAFAIVGSLTRLHLKDLTKLTVLWLDRNQVTDDGLAHLSGMKTPHLAQPRPYSSHRCRAGPFEGTDRS